MEANGSRRPVGKSRDTVKRMRTSEYLVCIPFGTSAWFTDFVCLLPYVFTATCGHSNAYCGRGVCGIETDEHHASKWWQARKSY
jgi:hypothetical protein